MTVAYKYRGVAMLTLLVVVMPLVVWHYALRDTAVAWFECRRLAAQIEQVPETENTTMPVGTEAAEMIFSGALLDAVRLAAEASSVQVAGYEPLVTLRQDKTAVHTAQLTLNGSYAELLRLVDRIEHDLPQCRLRSLALQVTTERTTQRTQLTLILYVQQLIILE